MLPSELKITKRYQKLYEMRKFNNHKVAKNLKYFEKKTPFFPTNLNKRFNWSHEWKWESIVFHPITSKILLCSRGELKNSIFNRTRL